MKEEDSRHQNVDFHCYDVQHASSVLYNMNRYFALSLMRTKLKNYSVHLYDIFVPLLSFFPQDFDIVSAKWSISSE